MTAKTIEEALAMGVCYAPARVGGDNRPCGDRFVTHHLAGASKYRLCAAHAEFAQLFDVPTEEISPVPDGWRL